MNGKTKSQLKKEYYTYFDVKALYVAFKPSIKKVEGDPSTPVDYKGLIFNPFIVGNNSDAMILYDAFFKRTKNFKMLPVITEQIPDELANNLKKDYNVTTNQGVSCFAVSMEIPTKSIDKLVSDLTKNPLKYYTSDYKNRNVQIF